uniref:Multi-ubiquitin domain-containing protein n=1 Tax=viral metagenome TaxID=1070528 RepID=A0A6M3L003_9ZZZZ
MDDEELGLEEEDEGEMDEEETPNPRWATPERTEGQPVFVDVGRGQTVQVNTGDSFEATLTRLADEAHYGGYYRVYLNGSEIINPEDSPTVVEPGMRIAITAYDKVG